MDSLFNDEISYDDLLLIDDLEYAALSATLPINYDDGDICPEEAEEDQRTSSQEMVPDFPPVQYGTPTSPPESAREVSSYGVVCHRIGDTPGWFTPSAYCSFVPGTDLLERRQLLRSGWRQTWKLPTDEESAEVHCLCDKGRAI